MNEPQKSAGLGRSPESESLYQRLVESIHDYAIYMLDAGGTVISWNPGAQRFKGYSADEIIGRHFSVFYTTADRAAGKPQRALTAAALSGRFEDQAWRVRKDGRQFRAHVIIDPVRNDQGEVIGFAKITRDISEAYQKECALRDSEQRFRLLVSGVSDYAIYMLDLNGHVTSWNAGAERLKGYKKDEVIQQNFSIFYTQADRDDDKPARDLQTALNQGRSEDTGWRIRKDGSQFWAQTTIELIHDDHGVPMGYAKITRDISDRRAADIRVRDLTSANEELESFVHVASHDLREPLRKILAFGDLLLEEKGAVIDDDGRRYIASISSSTRRMQELLASLLQLTKVTSHGKSFDPCSLDEVLSDVAADLEIVLREKNVGLSVQRLPEIEADAAQMRQLFQNLIENSIKYARAGVAPLIRIAALPDDDPQFAHIVVSDNGIGFEQKYADKIFGIFQRLHPRSSYAGAGVGLSICKKICHRHGGSIVAIGLPDQGAEFHIRLPKRHQSNA